MYCCMAVLVTTMVKAEHVTGPEHPPYGVAFWHDDKRQICDNCRKRLVEDDATKTCLES
jgi:hypothetical protein